MWLHKQHLRILHWGRQRRLTVSTEQLATGKPREARDKPLSGEERGWGSDEAGTQNIIWVFSRSWEQNEGRVDLISRKGKTAGAVKKINPTNKVLEQMRERTKVQRSLCSHCAANGCVNYPSQHYTWPFDCGSPGPAYCLFPEYCPFFLAFIFFFHVSCYPLESINFPYVPLVPSSYHWFGIYKIIFLLFNLVYIGYSL